MIYATAAEKLKNEFKESKDKRVPGEHILKHLLTKCKEDEEFSRRINLEEKTLKGCFDYVFNEVKKKLNGSSGWVEDNEVYRMAETYWLLNMTELKDIETKYEDDKKSNTTKVKKDKEKVEDAALKEDTKQTTKDILINEQLSILDIVG